MAETGSTQPQSEAGQYEQIHKTVAAEFTVEEGFIEYNTPTFYITLQPNLKQAFLRLYKQLDSKQLVPVLRKRENRLMLQIVPKPPAKPSKPFINVALLAATIATTLVSGYFLSLGLGDSVANPWVGAAMFSIAIMSILGTHEMGHKFTADRHKIEATYPYFIPGLPPFGTFGAVIQQKSLPPNKDSLFDLGLSGPLTGFIATIIVTIIGTQLSILLPEAPKNSQLLPVPILFDFITALFPPKGSGTVILLHPVAYAGYIGMLVTTLNLMPVGQLDGGHIAHVLLGEKARVALAYAAIITLIVTGYWFMAVLAFLIARVRHPDPLDGVSNLSTGRKLATILVILVFVLSFTPLEILLPTF